MIKGCHLIPQDVDTSAAFFCWSQKIRPKESGGKLLYTELSFSVMINCKLSWVSGPQQLLLLQSGVLAICLLVAVLFLPLGAGLKACGSSQVKKGGCSSRGYSRWYQYHSPLTPYSSQFGRQSHAMSCDDPCMRDTAHTPPQ